MPGVTVTCPVCDTTYGVNVEGWAQLRGALRCGNCFDGKDPMSSPALAGPPALTVIDGGLAPG